MNYLFLYYIFLVSFAIGTSHFTERDSQCNRQKDASKPCVDENEENSTDKTKQNVKKKRGRPKKNKLPEISTTTENEKLQPVENPKKSATKNKKCARKKELINDGRIHISLFILMKMKINVQNFVQFLLTLQIFVNSLMIQRMSRSKMPAMLEAKLTRSVP